LERDSSIVDRVLLVACVLAQTCSSLAANDLRRCASSLLGVGAESELASAFIRRIKTSGTEWPEREIIR
jgi:hypothetical protein